MRSSFNRTGDLRDRSIDVGSWRPLAMAVIVAALLARAMWGVAVPVVPISDSIAYDTFAQHLASGGAYGWNGTTPSAYWPVGTAFIYSLVYRVWDPQILGFGGVVMLNMLAGVAVVALTMVLTARWLGARAGLAAGALMAVWPMHVQFTTVIASELYFTAFCLAGILAWPGAESPGKSVWMRRLLLAGVFFALAAYIRPTGLLLPVVLAGAGILREGAIRRNIVNCGLVSAIMLLVIMPWSMRNQAAFDRFVLISTNGGANLWMGNNPESTGGYQPIPPCPPGMNEAEFESLLSQEALAHIRAEPAAFITRTAVKAVRMHERETIGVVWNQGGLEQVAPDEAIVILKWVSQAFWLGVLGAAAMGLILLAKARGLWWVLTHPAVLIWAYFTAVHAVIVYQDRYHFPVTPMIGAIAAVALVQLCMRAARGMLPVGGVPA